MFAQGLAAVELLLAPFPIRSADTCFGWRELAEAVAPLRSPEEFVFAGEFYKVVGRSLEFYGRREGLRRRCDRPAGDTSTPIWATTCRSCAGKRDAIFVDPDVALRG